MLSRFSRFGAVFVCICALIARAVAATATVVVLHTNDLHDHVRSGQDQQGGLPWISAYVKQLRAERSDVILLDAGDVSEKGDMVSARTDSVIMYEAMRRIGYDAVTIGNHDCDVGFDRARKYQEALGQAFLNCSLFNPDGTAAFAPTRILTVGQLKIGIIGAMTPWKRDSLNEAEIGAAIHRHALELRPKVQLLIALCHEGSKVCTKWSRQAPEVDVFVSAHTHELLEHPVIVPGTGARIVQAGRYGQHVGRLDLTVDLEQRKIVAARDEIVPLPHATSPVDAAMLAWVRAREQKVCPEAARMLVEHNADHLAAAKVAALGAEAVRRAAKADLGFCGAERGVRSPIYPGPLDVNAVFCSVGMGGELMAAELTGAEITAYLTSLQQRDQEQTNWAGFKAKRGKGGAWTTNLEPAKKYRVAFSKLEWNTRFLRAVDRERAADSPATHPLLARKFKAKAGKTDLTLALSDYIAGLNSAHTSLARRAEELVAAGKLD
ncbi:metallophosphoesterase [Opitutus sp. ER46]|uniref:bifunctional metallophosphatase/5'-nucleotidase n=1 Tax=Opitutus sp. ER46 TaxID=2161864 RepID=UPI000D311ED6|nr:metallophosphoesterase [Opitutus sp. ER46]PTX91606.1 hypothetical protein DB354_17180 [Opitutus sp. ER46]